MRAVEVAVVTGDEGVAHDADLPLILDALRADGLAARAVARDDTRTARVGLALGEGGERVPVADRVRAARRGGPARTGGPATGCGPAHRVRAPVHRGRTAEPGRRPASQPPGTGSQHG
ncbi:hypothetical protein [Streptomyces sp. NPDC058701]|uniref:hypothetical protein n=1 Tax=Streptomyces sp. NPDC058701 TaxID=3346608 RepID=UPI00365AF08B